MEALVVVALVVLVAAVVITLSIAHAKATDEAWSRAAQRLGVRFQPGGLFQSRSLTGNQQGFSVHVDTYTRRSGKHSRTYTRFHVRYPRPLGLGLQLTRQGFFSGIARFFGGQDLEVGDAHFDGGTVVKGTSPLRLREFLTPSRRLRISRFLEQYSDATIGDASIEWTASGLIRDAGRLVAHVESTVRLGWHLVEDRQADRELEQVMAAQEEGRPEEALRMISQRHKQTDARRRGESPFDEDAPQFEPVPVEERLIEAELLHLGGRDEEAREVLAKAAEHAPQDQELHQWADSLAQRPKPLPSAATMPVAGEPLERAPADDAALDAATVCEALFASSSSFAARQVFEDRYAGKIVRWRGVLERVDEYTYDLVFHGREGCKGVLQVHELATTPYGQRKVLAVVQFPRTELEDLRKSIGQPLEFTGQLVKADGLMRNIYLVDGRTSSQPRA